MKDIYIADLAAMDEGRNFDGFFLVLVKQQRTTRQGKPYLSLTLADKTGSIEARIWEPNDPRIARDFKQGDMVKVRASASRFDEKLQMKIENLRTTLAGEADRADMLPSTKQDVATLWQQLTSFVGSFRNADLKRLLEALMAEPAIAGAYREAPAAKQLHHAWLGGLLEHVVGLLTLADRVVALYPQVDRDLLLTGVILHDLGKVRELAWETGFEYTTEGILLGHIQMGVAMVERAIDRLPDFPPRLKTIVVHMILAHHGKLEFGSPKLPMIPEALMLNFLDDMDAKMQAVEGAFDKARREGRPADEFTDKVWALDQRMMLDTRAWLAARETPVSDEPDPAGGQNLLFVR